MRPWEALPASSRRFPRSAARAGSDPPPSYRGAFVTSPKGVIIHFCAPKYTVTFVPRALGNTIYWKHCGQEKFYPVFLPCRATEVHEQLGRSIGGTEHLTDQVITLSGIN